MWSLDRDYADIAKNQLLDASKPPELSIRLQQKTWFSGNV